jgi:hypothetical protein
MFVRIFVTIYSVMPNREYEASRTAENASLIEAAIASLDAYDSPRAKEANDRRGDSGYEFVTSADGHLELSGVTHTYNPDSEVVRALKDDLGRFLDANPGSVHVIIEGRPGLNEEMLAKMQASIENPEDAVRKFGEAGIAIWESKNRGLDVKITSPEKDESEIVEVLKAQGFASEDLASYLALRRFTDIFRKEGAKKSRAEILDLLARDFYNQQRITGVTWIQDFKSEEDLIAMMDRDSKLPEPMEIPVYMETIVRQYLQGLNTWVTRPKDEGGVLNQDIASFDGLLNQDEDRVSLPDINDLHDPLDANHRNSRINAVSAAWNGERDKYLVVKMGEARTRGENIYVIFGASHVSHIGPAVQELEKIKT